MRSEAVATNLRCNQNCTYCVSRRPSDDLSQIQPAVVRAQIDRHLAAGAEEIVLTGGEPTLRGDLAVLVAHARDGGATVALETNATLVDAPRAAALAAAGLAVARVNLSGTSEALDAVTRDPGGFQRTLAGMRALVDAHIALEVEAALVRSTRALLPSLPGFLHERFGAAIRQIFVVAPHTSPDPGELLAYEEAAPVVLEMEANARRAGLPLRMSRVPGPPPCVFPPSIRSAGLYALTRGGAARDGFRKVTECAGCQVNDRCPGFPAEYLAVRALPPLHPIREERLRRRLSVISTVRDQVEREFVQIDRFPGSTQPDRVCIRINFHCNQACHFCFVSTHLPSVSDERVRAAILEAAGRGAEITLTGGEPTLNPRVVEWVSLAKAHSRHRVELQTNAVRLDDPALAQALARAGLDIAWVSLHGVTAEVSDQVTDAPGTFVRTLAGLDNLHAAGVPVTVNFVVCGWNYRELPAVPGLIASRWPRARFNISFVAPSTDVIRRDTVLVPRYSAVFPFVTAAWAEAQRLGVSVSGSEGMCGIPRCLIPESMLPHVSDAALAEDGGEFMKPETCRACAYDARCYGLRKSYVELHGSDEVRPL